MGHQSRTADQEIARIASGQHGIVDRGELLAAGLTRKEIRSRLDRGSLLPQFPGVYRVGHQAPSTEASYMAAVKACGDGARLRGRAAAHLLRLLNARTPPPPEVTTRTERRIKGLSTKRCRNLDRRDTTTVRGIPTTTVPRTLVDLAAVLDEDELARACHQAQIRYGTTLAQVEAALTRCSNAPGARKLRKVLHGDVRLTLSKLERWFLDLLRRHKLPLPITNRKNGSYYVDCRWPEFKLTVELNSYAFHNSRHSWTQDYRREREAHQRGDDYRRFIWEDVTKDPAPMLAELTEIFDRLS